MCWILHGALRGDVDESALNAINQKHLCHIVKGSRHDVKNAVVNDTWDCRVTDGQCDCGSPIGGGDPADELVADLAGLISEAAALPGAQTLSICMAWAGKRCKQERTVALSALELPQWLADFPYGTLFTLELQK